MGAYKIGGETKRFRGAISDVPPMQKSSAWPC